MGEHILITREEGLLMFRVCTHMYKLGIKHAFAQIETNDEGACLEYLSSTSEPGFFGLLNEEQVYDAHTFSGRVERVAREELKIKNGIRKIIDKVYCYTASVYSVFLVACLQMYRKGIRDYIRHPKSGNLPLLDNKASVRVRWTEKGLKRVDARDFMLDIREEVEAAMYRDGNCLADFERFVKDGKFLNPIQNPRRRVIPEVYYRRYILMLNQALRRNEFYKE